MAYRVFCVPAAAGSTDEAAELNAFLRGHKVVGVHREFLPDGTESRWCFCVEYLDGTPPSPPHGSLAKVDYREVLDDAQFERFRRQRAARKAIAEEDGVPVYAVFTNDQLAEMARGDGPPTATSLRKIDGIGEKKAARYGERFAALVAEMDAADGAGGASRPGEPMNCGSLGELAPPEP